jgi:hypothetical protein
MNNGTFGFPQKKYEQIGTVIEDGQLEVVASKQVIAGDLVGLSSSGFVPIQWDSTIPSQNIGVIPYQATADTIQGSEVSTGLTASSGTIDAALLTTGDVVLAFRDNASNNAAFAIYNSAGVIKGSATQLGFSTISGCTSRVLALNTGDFIVASGVSSGTNYVFNRFNSDGVAQGGSVTVSTYYSSGQIPDLALLKNGNFVFAGQNTAGDVFFGIYSPTGVLQGSLTMIAAGIAAAARSPKIVVLENGDFVVVYNGTSGVDFARYNSSGVLQGSITTVSAGASSPARFSTAALTGGGFAVCFRRSISAADFATFNSSGVLQGSLLNYGMPNNVSSPSLDALPDGTWVGSVSTTTNSVTLINVAANGSVIQSRTVSGSVTNTGVKTLPTGQVLVANTATNTATFYRINQSLAAQNSAVTLPSNVTTDLTPNITILNNGQIVLSYSVQTSGSYRFCRYSGERIPIYGVTENSASAGSRCVVRFGGANGSPRSVALRNDWGAASVAFDGISVGATKGRVIQNNAYLEGF